MCAPSPPPAPDYAGAATAQGEANLEAAVAQGHINNPNVVSPYGTQTVTWGGPIAPTQTNFDPAAYLAANPDVAAAGVDPWSHYQQWGTREGRAFTPLASAQGNDPTLTQTLSPEQLAIYRQQAANQLATGNLASQGINTAQGVLGTKLDYSGLPGLPSAFQGGHLPQAGEAIRQQVTDAMMGRVNTDYARNTDQQQANLRAAGIPTSSEAYGREMETLNRGLNDARQQAILAGGQAAAQQYGMDSDTAKLWQAQQQQGYQQQMAGRQQSLAELMGQRQAPLNEITALMSGSQVSNPFQMPGYVQNANVQPAPIFGATQATGDWNANMYNQQAAQAGNLQSGLFQLGAGTAMAF